MRNVTKLVVHCTSGPQDQKTTDIKTYWAHKLGWKSYGYHYLIAKDGTTEELTPIEKPSNGVKGHNHDSIHICYKGGSKGIDDRTPEQKAAIIRILRYLKVKFPKAKIMGHRDLSPDLDGDGIIEPHEWVKKCPAFDVKQFCKENGIV